MPAYVVVQAEIIDGDKFREYLKETPRAMFRFGGRYIARGGETVVLEGDGSGKRVVIIEFPTLQKAKDWYYSEEYQQIKTLRKGAAIGSLIAIDGV